MIDIHLHTSFSHDSDEPMENYVKAAVNAGHGVIGFSEHYDYDCVTDYGREFLAPLGDYDKAVAALKSRYGGNIEILKGIELGYAKTSVAENLRVVNENRFDYVINSVHTVPPFGDCYFPEFFEGKTIKQAYGAYFDAVLESVYAPYDYQIVGHIGYVARYCRCGEPRVKYEDYAAVLDEILKAVIKLGKCLEINTSVGISGNGFLPDEDVLARYLELGGEKITFGSDAHRVSKYMYGAERVKKLLSDLGVKKACYYKNKECNFYDL